uniref:Uncharacterized protein n=1 Tax=Sciurus vulgaris TaxID=55149 RepID=A0A8D2AYI0_SCIVU
FEVLRTMLVRGLPSLGVGCQFLQEVLTKTIDSSVSMDEYEKVVEGFVTDDLDKKSVQQFKQCFLNQSNETLGNVQVMMVIWVFSLYLIYQYSL